MLPGNGPGPLNQIDRRLWQNSVDMSRDGLTPIRKAAREHGVVVVMGVNERASEMSDGTICNTSVIIDADGSLLNVHRKLIPTNPERMVWGYGDGTTLRVVDTAVNRARQTPVRFEDV